MAKGQKNVPKRSQRGKMEKLGPNFSFSVRARLHNYIRADGFSAIYLLIIINGKRKKIPLNLYCNPKNWDKSKNEIKRSVKDADSINLIIRKAVANANDIAIRHRLQGMPLDLQRMEYLLGSAPQMTGDFIAFMEAEIERRTAELGTGTIRHHKSTARKLRDCFPDGLPMTAVNHDAVEKFVQYLHMLGLKRNTRIGNLKRFQTYVKRAQRDDLIYGNPFEHHTLRYHNSDRTALTTDELNRLIELYRASYISTSMRNTLRCFLFACYTGIRISDLEQVCKRQIIKNELVIIPKKTKDTGKIIHIPLNKQALSYLNTDDVEWRFNMPAHATMNEILKDVDRLCGIRKKLHFHMSRHTFATRFLAAGGNVEVLQQLLGHNDLATTMVYVHINDDRKREQIELMD